MSGDESLHARVIRACAVVLDTDLVGVREIDREQVLNLMAKAYVAGRQSGLDEWGASIDRMQAAIAEAEE